MTYFIANNVNNYVVATGFKTEEDAERYIKENPYMAQYWYRYCVEAWTAPYAYGLTYDREGVETMGATYLLFETWDEAIDYAVNHPFDLEVDFDYEEDIYQIDMTKVCDVFYIGKEKFFVVDD